MVEKGAEPSVSRARKAFLRGARGLTTPLMPDDYLELLNPLWTTRELRGRVVETRPETADATTVVIEPSAPWPGHKPGQYLRVGAEIDGVRKWRAYSITSDPDHPRNLVSITVKCVEEGEMSPFFSREIGTDAMVFLGEVEGTFNLPDPLPDKALMVSAGSGITPIMSMVRELNRRSALNDVVHVHSVRKEEDFIFADMLKRIADANPGYDLRLHLSGESGRIEPTGLEKACGKDWRDRQTFMSGPADLLDVMTDHWEAETNPDLLKLERFQPRIVEDAESGEGGTIRFRVTEVDAESDGSQPILVAGEEAGGELPFGCRQGICHTCVGRLCQGRVRDLRTGEVHGEEGEMIRTCVNAPEGHIEMDL